MDKSKAVIAGVGAIVLGAAGSALWDFSKPLLGWSWTAMLEIATLGLESVRDGLYADAAGTYLDRNFARGIVVVAIALGLLYGSLMISTAQLTLALSAHARWSFRWVAVLSLGGAAALLTHAFRWDYSANLARHYMLLEAMAAPHFNESERKENAARFVQVKTSAAYLVEVERLSSRIRSAGAVPPERSFF